MLLNFPVQKMICEPRVVHQLHGLMKLVTLLFAFFVKQLVKRGQNRKTKVFLIQLISNLSTILKPLKKIYS